MALHGGIITKRPLCYTADGRLLLAPCGNDIRVYSSKSGEHIATLKGHEAEVTSVVQMDSSSSKLVSSSHQQAASCCMRCTAGGSFSN
jgi:NET1-associated nuclear protein 1 (U3 small nucleolar RNA-associated protein 17)